MTRLTGSARRSAGTRIGALALLGVTVGLWGFGCQNSEREEGRGVSSGVTVRAESLVPAREPPPAVASSVSQAPIDVDWHTGLLAGLYFPMRIEDVPSGLRGQDAFDETFDAGSESRRALLTWVLDRRHIYVPFRLSQSTHVFNIRSPVQELLFIGDFDVEQLLRRGLESYRNDPSFAAPMDNEAGLQLQSSLRNARLRAITVYAGREYRGRLCGSLEDYLRADPRDLNTPPVDYYFLSGRGSVDTLSFWYETCSWRLRGATVEAVEVHENGRVTQSYFVLSDSGASTADQLPPASAGRQGVLRPDAVSAFMAELRQKGWRAGAGWVREILGSPIDPMNPGAQYWPWQNSNTSMWYLINLGTVFRVMHLRFDETGMLSGTELTPRMEGDEPLYAESTQRIRGDEPPEVLAARLRAILVPEGRSFSWDGGRNPSGSTWTTGGPVLHVDSEGMVTRERTIRFRDIDSVSVAEGWTSADRHVLVRVYPSYIYDHLRMYARWRSANELNDAVTLMSSLSGRARGR